MPKHTIDGLCVFVPNYARGVIECRLIDDFVCVKTCGRGVVRGCRGNSKIDRKLADLVFRLFGTWLKYMRGRFMVLQYAIGSSAIALWPTQIL